MDKTFIEMKLFQVKPDKLEQFETKIEEMTTKQLKCDGCISLKYYSYWEFDTKENYGKAIKIFFDNYNKELQKLLIAPFDINLGYSV